MENKRRSERFSTNMIAKYSSGEGETWKECIIMNICRGGVGLVYFEHEKIDIDSTLYLTISVPNKTETINIEGKVRWTEQAVKGFNAGIEVTSESDQTKLVDLIRQLIRSH